jgi:hypothetical protein
VHDYSAARRMQEITLGPFDHNQICTRDKCIRVGGVYRFREGESTAQVRVTENLCRSGWIGFKLRVVQHLKGPPLNAEFQCGAAMGLYAYANMWRLSDVDDVD